MHNGQIAILLGTFNGRRFLPAQIDSILQQSIRSWSMWVSDDGSVDGTLALLQGYQSAIGGDRLHIFRGPQKGFARNFLSLVCKSDIQADYFAFADQDDVWLPDKLEHASTVLKSCPSDRPALYCSCTLIINEFDVEQGQFLHYHAKPSFCNALIQNIASGNTMVFNAAARELLLKAGPDVDVFAHDWWVYLAVMAVGGIVIFDPVPRVQYRQHADNQVGATLKLRQLMRRTQLDRNGHLRSTFRRNIAALERIRSQMTPQNLSLLSQAQHLWQGNALSRTLAFLRLPFKRQRFLGNVSLALAVLLGRV